MSTPWPIVALIGLLGLVIGSFLNVVIYRVPRDQSVVSPASRCPSCDTALKPWHNVPVLSWLALRGRCAFCKNEISTRYPLVEAGTATLFSAITLRFGLHIDLPAYLFLAAVGVTLALIDFDMKRLPDRIVLPSYIVAVLLLMPAGAVSGDWRSAVRALAGMGALAAIYFALAFAYPRGLDLGDVKVAGLLGLYLGWVSWSAVLIGAVGGLVIGALGGSSFPINRSGKDGSTIAFAPSLIAAAVLALFITVPLSSWYTSLLAST
jgi:leader peptidase (prepilin peptidase) / N-methyltransferase